MICVFLITPLFILGGHIFDKLWAKANPSKNNESDGLLHTPVGFGKRPFSVWVHIYLDCCCKKRWNWISELLHTPRESTKYSVTHTELALFVGFSIRVWIQDYSVVWCAHNLILPFIFRSDADNPNDVTVRKDHKPARRVSSTRQELLTESSSPDWHQEHVE